MNKYRKPRGATFIECMVALVILGAALLAAAQMTVTVMGQQRHATQRQLARQEAANLMEEIFGLSQEGLTQWASAGRELELSETARNWLPEAVVTAAVDTVDESPPGKRIQVEVRWTDKSGQPARPVRMIAWRFDREAQP
jgi:prepilin-type N-terminal cleavage/methylation domain-containing protein